MSLLIKNKKNSRKFHLLIIILYAIILAGCQSKNESSQDSTLWYKQPAKEWTDALPIGNGNLGAMIFGGVKKDHIQFNDATFWTGEPRDYNRKDAFRYLPEIRKLLFEGKQKEVEAIAQKHFMGEKNHEDSYDSLFAIWLKQVRAPENLSPSQPNYNDSSWQEIKVPDPNGFERVIPSLEGENGAFWFRTTFTLPEQWREKDLILALGHIRDMDFTYVNGHFLGSENGMDTIREYIIPASVLHAGKNVIAIQDINPDNKGGLSGYRHAGKRMCVYPKGGNYQQGINLEKVWKSKVQNDSPPRFPHYNASYQPFADLWLTFPDSNAVTHYKRSLNLHDAICATSYVMNGIQYKREYFASAPNQAIVIHLSANRQQSINFSASLTSKHHLSVVKKIDDHTIAIDIKLKKGVLRGESRLRIQAKNGQIKIDSGIMTVSHADDATLYLVAGTSFINYKNVSGNPSTACMQALHSLKDKSYAEVKTAHIQAYQKLFDTFSIDLGHTDKENLPTDERIQQFDTVSDPSLVSLYMQYGRYLLIASSWPGTYPANLQGIWNDDMRPPWGSKYTTNINLEMNYWPSEVLNLSACHEPLFAMMMNLAKSGHETAEDYYGCPGWVLHHNTDIWLGTAPVDNADHGIWPTGGAWLCHQLWEHFQFTQDTVFLRDTAYPVMKSAAQFFNCFLIKDPKTGCLISSPSNSPEHGGLVAGPTMDNQIIRDLFKNFIKASEILQTDNSFRDTLEEKYQQIAANQIGKYGQLQEWLHDIDDTSDHHRHVSHLWGVFPGTDITWQTPRFMKAARQSLIYRGDAGTGWSLAWKMNLWDRFKDGNHAYRLLKIMLNPADAPGRKSRGGSYPDLFDAHPPFQIDGNFGGATGLANMLIQSETGVIQLLPALPDALPSGSVKGICARGGFVLNLSWSGRKLQHVQVLSKAGKNCTLIYEHKKISFNTRKGETFDLDGNLKML